MVKDKGKVKDRDRDKAKDNGKDKDKGRDLRDLVVAKDNSSNNKAVRGQTELKSRDSTIINTKAILERASIRASTRVASKDCKGDNIKDNIKEVIKE
ncbi:AGAP010845-PA-like protein [Anopheles sinensis]|uniref:AGAP010845-PA-like protein n=1 Tax=Anopheles sinensis TaxID=74873 RepID=A0A084WUN0_ANOSI|nr:AGAP010845-PA-like protein [Anopheles sinensis]